MNNSMPLIAISVVLALLVGACELTGGPMQSGGTLLAVSVVPSLALSLVGARANWRQLLLEHFSAPCSAARSVGPWIKLTSFTQIARINRR